MGKREVNADDLNHRQIRSLQHLSKTHGYEVKKKGEMDTAERISDGKHYVDTRTVPLQGWPVTYESSRYEYKTGLDNLAKLGLVKKHEKLVRDSTKPSGRNVITHYEITKDGEKLIEEFYAERSRALNEQMVAIRDSGILKAISANFLSRISAFIFFIAGLGFMVASDFSSTGHAIANTAPYLAPLPAFLSILLATIGGYLFIKSK